MKKKYSIAFIIFALICSCASFSGCGKETADKTSLASENSSADVLSSVLSEYSLTDERSNPSESGTTVESNTSAEGSTNGQTSETGAFLWDDSCQRPDRVNYDYGLISINYINDKDEINRLFDVLAKTKIGEETTDMAKEPDRRIFYVNKTTMNSEELVFNGHSLRKNGKLYKLIDGEKLFKTIDNISWIKDIEPTPPHFRAYSPEDPDNTTPMYIVPPTEENIVVDPETKTQYAKNQLIVIVAESNYAEYIGQIAIAFDAEIVGHEEISDSYQFQFKEDLNMKQLKEKAVELMKNKYIEYADLYLIGDSVSEPNQMPDDMKDVDDIVRFDE